MVVNSKAGIRYHHGILRFDTTRKAADNYCNEIEAINTSYGVLDQAAPLWCLFMCLERHMVQPINKHPGPRGNHPQTIVIV